MRLTQFFLLSKISASLMLVVSGFVQTALSAPVIPTNDPVSGYLFDEGSGSTLGDEFGSNNGTLFNMEAGDWVVSTTPFSYAGNTALNFDPTGAEHVNLGQPTDLPLTPSSSYTVSVWYQADDDGTFIARGGGDTNERMFQLGLFDPGGDSLNVVAGGTNIAYSENNDNDWHHVAVVNNAGTITVYLDSTLVQTGTAGVEVQSPMDLLIGMRRGTTTNTGTGFEYDGRLDELAFWTEALSADNIEWLSENSISDLLNRNESFAVPEPSSAILLFVGVGLICSLVARRRLRASRS